MGAQVERRFASRHEEPPAMASTAAFRPTPLSGERGLSASEIRAHVRDYFTRLESELRGRGNRRSALSRGATAEDERISERTYRRIAGALVEHGLPYMSTYKPLPGGTETLDEAVASYLRNHPEALRLMEADVDGPVGIVPDLEGRSPEEVLARTPDANDIPAMATEDRLAKAVSGVDFLAREQRNTSLAWAGELFVLQYEMTRLRAEGADMYADYVEHSSAEEGTGSGYDIHSYDGDGFDRYIKVKTTRYRRETPLFVTANEIAMAAAHQQRYWLYRVFEWRQAPRIYCINGALHERFQLEPVAYRATPT